MAISNINQGDLLYSMNDIEKLADEISRLVPRQDCDDYENSYYRKVEPICFKKRKLVDLELLQNILDNCAKHDGTYSNVCCIH